MDTGLDENKAELGVLVLAVGLEVLADGDGLEKFVSMKSSFEPMKAPRRSSLQAPYLLD